MDDRFMYQIHPRKPIVNLIPGKGIRKPMGIKLTKEEVLKCMEYGPVYRSFPSIPLIKVTGSNLDSLHVTEEEYLNKDKKEEIPSNSTETIVEEQIQKPIVSEEPKTEPLTEEVVEEKPVLEVKVDDVVEVEVPVEEEEVVEPEPIPVPVEPGPVIIEEEKKEEEPVPVPVEPGPVIIEEEFVSVAEETPVEEAVDEESEEEDSEDEEEDEEEVEETEFLSPVSNNGNLHPQQPRKKKKKHH